MGAPRSILSRYRQTNLWTRLSVWGSVASIIGLVLFFWPQSPSDGQSAVVEDSPKASVTQSGRDINAGQIGHQIINVGPQPSQTDEFSLTGSLSVEEYVLMEHKGVIDPHHHLRIVVLRATVVNNSPHDIYPLGIATTIVGKNPSSGESVCLSFGPCHTDSMDPIKPGEPRTFRFHLVRPAEIAALYQGGDASCLTTFGPSRGERRSIFWMSLGREFAKHKAAANVAEESLQSMPIDVFLDEHGLWKEMGWLDSPTGQPDFDILLVESSLNPPETRRMSVVETEAQARKLMEGRLSE